MGAYADSVLINGETIAYETRIHWAIYLFPFIMAGMLAIGLACGPQQGVAIFAVILFFILAIPFYIIRKTSEFAVTNKRVILKTGFISRKTFDMSLSKIEGLMVEQGILGRMMGYGTIIVRGTGGGSQPFKYIDDPMSFKRVIDEMAEQTKQ